MNKIIALLLVLTFAPTLYAETRWSDLPPESRQLLGQMEGKWDNLEEGRRQQLQQLSEQWLKLPSEKRTALWQRYQRWQRLPTEKQQQMERAYHRYQAMPTEQRQQLLQSHQRFHSMNPEQQQTMMQRFQAFQHRNRHHPGGGMSNDMESSMMESMRQDHSMTIETMPGMEGMQQQLESMQDGGGQHPMGRPGEMNGSGH